MINNAIKPSGIRNQVGGLNHPKLGYIRIRIIHHRGLAQRKEGSFETDLSYGVKGLSPLYGAVSGD